MEERRIIYKLFNSSGKVSIYVGHVGLREQTIAIIHRNLDFNVLANLCICVGHFLTISIIYKSFG
jgi:hypothetical protein